MSFHSPGPPALFVSVSPRSKQFDILVARIAYVALLALIFVGLSPFDARDPSSMTAAAAAVAKGDIVRQFSFLGVFGLSAFGCIRLRGLYAVHALSVSLCILMLWCIFSAFWADQPDAALRRSILASTFVLSILLSVEALGAEEAMRLWRMALAVTIVADWVSVALVRQAIHLPNDVEAELAGAWRGLQPHKNAAGFVAAMGAATFFTSALATKRWQDIALAAASTIFLVMTRSKTSLGLLPVALIAAALYRFTLRSSLDRAIAVVTATLLLVPLTVAVIQNWDSLLHVLDDPQQFTGRTAIWQAELAHIRDHPMLGAGFGSFSNTGANSPIYYYVGSSWVSKIGEGHSGYLEMLVTIGGIGFAIAINALLAIPFTRFWRPSRLDETARALLFALCTFIVIHNFLESDFLEGTSVQWGQYLLLIAFQRNAVIRA